MFATALVLSSCKTTGPDAATCISDPPALGLECVPKKADPNQEPYFIPFEKTDNFVCFDPDSWIIIVEWIHRNSRSPEIINDLKRRGLVSP